MRRAAPAFLALCAFALAACGDKDAVSGQGEIYGNVTAPASPDVAPNAPAGEVPPPQPHPEGGDTGIPSTPPTLPAERAPPAPVDSSPQ